MGTTMSSTLSPPLMTPTPAAQKVFCLHELVAQILSHLPHLYGAYAAESWEPVPWTANDTTNKGTRQHHAALIKLAQINTVWFNEAMRILWKEGTEIKQRSMIGLLENVQEEGRQFYAAFIKTAIIFDPHKGKVLASNKIIAGLDFSRLQYLSIILPNTQGTQKLCLPAIRAPQLKVLDIRRVASPLTQKLDSRKQSKEISQVWNPGYCRLRSLTMRSAETLVRVIKVRETSFPLIFSSSANELSIAAL